MAREVARNSGPNGYRAVRADRLAVKLALCWSPRPQSAPRARKPHNPSMRVSHETIYTSLFVRQKEVSARS